jgi:hypothetical protein
MSKKNNPSFCFDNLRITSDLALSEIEPEDQVIAAIQHYKLVDENRLSCSEIFPASCNSDFYQISQSIDIIIKEHIYASENYSRLNFIGEQLKHLKTIDTSKMRVKGKRLHSEKISNLLTDAVTIHNCIVKSKFTIELECNEIYATSKVLATNMENETQNWTASAEKMLNKILRGTPQQVE